MKYYFLAFTLLSLLWGACNTTSTDPSTQLADEKFDVFAESFADLQVLRYQVPGFENLSAKEKELVYYLYEAAMCGRDIIYDQKSKYGLTLRKTIEAMYSHVDQGDEWEKFKTYCGRFWFSNGNHHHYGNEKFFRNVPLTISNPCCSNAIVRNCPGCQRVS
jgi:hypothetical protein